MSFLRTVCPLLISATMVVVTTQAFAAGKDEQAARTAFSQLVAAAKNNKVDDFKKLVAKADLAEMEAMNKEQAGFFEMFMGFVAEGGDPKDYTAEVKPDAIIFTKRVEEKSASGSGTQTTKVRMIKENGQWRFGKPRP